MEEMNLRNYAYIGDAVWELFIREKTIYITDNAKQLHLITTEKVKAGYQAGLLAELDANLTEEEKDLARRARNLNIPIGRRSNQNEYRHSTAFEALIGYWNKENKHRLDEILKIIEKNLKF